MSANRLNPTEDVQSSDAKRRTVVSADARSNRVGVILLHLHGEDLENPPVCCHRLLIQLIRFNLEAEYMLLKTLVVAEMLNRSTQQQRAHKRDRNSNIKCYIAVVMSNIPASQKKMDGIGAKRTADEHLKGIFKYVKNGWLNTQKPRRGCARDYFPVGK